MRDSTLRGQWPETAVDNVKAILSSQAVQKQVAGWIWWQTPAPEESQEESECRGRGGDVTLGRAQVRRRLLSPILGWEQRRAPGD